MLSHQNRLSFARRQTSQTFCASQSLLGAPSRGQPDFKDVHVERLCLSARYPATSRNSRSFYDSHSRCAPAFGDTSRRCVGQVQRAFSAFLSGGFEFCFVEPALASHYMVMARRH